MSSPFIEENDQTRARREHLERIRELVGNAYPNKFRRTNVAASDEGEDTISVLVRPETLSGIIGGGGFGDMLAALKAKVEAGERPSSEDLEAVNAELNQIRVRVAGRIATPPRVMGKAAFVHLSDGGERLQIYVRRQDARAVSNDTGQPVDDFDSGWQLFQLLDHGDFVGVEGELFVTKTGELSVHVRELQFLAKALVPMPDKMHGINDPEIRQRQRYADLIASSLKVKTDAEEEGGETKQRELSTREVFVRRSRMITEMRRYLDAHGYVEVETPMLSPIASGAAARPFVTHHNALDIDLYLRIAPELYLKRLVVGGFERVYELNRNFRNEGIGYRWNPEFTMLEFYCAYMDADGMMDFCEEMLQRVIQTVHGSFQVHFGDEVIDFSKFHRLTMKQAIAKCWDVANDADDPRFSLNIEMLNDPRIVYVIHGTIKAGLSQYIEGMTPEVFTADLLHRTNFVERSRRLNISPEELEPEETGKRIQFIFESLYEDIFKGRLEQPTFITDFPKVISPLSKASPEKPAVAERFELFAAGMEVANGFSELNDPVEQYERFEEQVRQRERGDDEAMQMDVDYVRALSYGMPPAAGIGIGVDRLAMLLTNRRSIRDVILFPHMRPQRPKEEEAEE